MVDLRVEALEQKCESIELWIAARPSSGVCLRSLHATHPRTGARDCRSTNRQDRSRSSRTTGTITGAGTSSNHGAGFVHRVVPMSGPRNADQAGRMAVQLLKRSLPGHSVVVRRECQRAAGIAAVIWRRWHVGPWQWKSKHVRWFLEHRCDEYRAWTRYRYWLTIERLLSTTGKLEDWRAGLHGPWLKPFDQRRERNKT